MNIVYVTKNIGSFRVEREILELGMERKIPLKIVDMVVMLQDVKMDSKSIIRLSKANIPLLFVSGDNKYFALNLPQIAKNSDLKALQYKALDRRVEIARTILHRKFETHLESLISLGVDFECGEYFEALGYAKNTDELLGIEGRFAKRYFDRYFGLFPKVFCKGYRSKNPPLDPLNAILSFIYTLGYNMLTSKLYMSGFEPSISYLHIPFRSHYALSSDILELHRAEINGFVFRLFIEKRFFRIEDFSNKDGVYLKSEKRVELWKELGDFIDKIGRESRESLAWLRRELYQRGELS